MSAVEEVPVTVMGLALNLNVALSRGLSPEAQPIHLSAAPIPPPSIASCLGPGPSPIIPSTLHSQVCDAVEAQGQGKPLPREAGGEGLFISQNPHRDSCHSWSRDALA